MIELTAEEARVLGALIEKEATVPDTYPMTLNGLRSACNQSSNRDPVVAYDEGTIQRALDSTKAKGLSRFVHASHGARTTKHRHVLDEALGLDRAELAVLSVLLLRGPQTAGELRTRTERQQRFESVTEVEATLAALAGREEPLVRLLEREPGRREPRWTQLLTPAAAGTTSEPAAGWTTGPPVAGSYERVASSVGRPPGDGDAARDEVAALRAELAELRSRFDELCRRLGESDL